MLRAAVVAVLMLVTPGLLQAQPRPSQIRGSVGAGFFDSAEEHLLAGASWRKYLGRRGWGLEVESLIMYGDDVALRGHIDVMLALDVVKDLAPPDRRTVPYLAVRGPAVYSSNRGTWDIHAYYAIPSVGVGVTRWSASRRVFIAPEFSFGIEPTIRLSVAVGFAP